MISSFVADGKNAIISITANIEPALIPIIPESAIGFLVFPCITAPETESETPTIISAKRRGMRKFRTMTWLISSASKRNSAFHISDSLIAFAPRTINATERMTSIPTHTASKMKNLAELLRGVLM